MTNKTEEHLSDYDRLSEEGWNGSIKEHIRNMDRVVDQAIYNAFTDYLRTVFGGDHDNTELKFVDELIGEYKARFAHKAFPFDGNHTALFGADQLD